MSREESQKSALPRSATNASITRRSVIAGALSGAFVGPLGAQHAIVRRDRRLVYALSSFPAHLRPWENVGSAAAAVKTAIFRGLLGYDQSGALRGEVAEHWDFVTDRELQFRIRADASFHDGSAITSEDVLYSIDTIRSDSVAFLHEEFQNIRHIECPDARTVILHLKETNVLLPNMLASSSAAIMSRGSTRETPIGCGPFIVTEVERGSFVRTRRFPGFYRGPSAVLDELLFQVYADDRLRVSALNAGDIDILEYVPWESMDGISRDDRFALDVTSGPFMYLVFNVQAGPLADPRVRRAIGYALNRREIIAAALAGKGEALNGLPIPPGSDFNEPAPDHEWSYDPERAKHLLSEAGFPNGFTTSLLSTAQYSFHLACAEVIQANLADVGIDATLELPDFATRVQRGSRGQYEIGLHGSAGDYNDPDALTPFLSSRAPSLLRSFGFESERIDGLLEQGRRRPARSSRALIYNELKKAFFEEAPFVGIATRQQAFAVRKNIRKFRNLPGFLSFLSNYSLDELEME